MKVTRKSAASGIERTLDLNVTQEQLDELEKGEKKIQEIFQQLNDSEREFILTGITQEEWDSLFPDNDSTESIECPYCDGSGYTLEHNHLPEEECNGCPTQAPCGYCYADGRGTTKLMKRHIAESNIVIDSTDDLPF